MSNNPKTSPYRWVVLAIVSMAAGVSCYAQFCVAARAFELIPALQLSMPQFAMIMSAPMFPNIFLGIPSGALADRFGVKAVVGIGLVIAIIGTTFRYLANDFSTYFIYMMLSGIGVMCINANIGKIVGAWFEDKQVPTALGIYYAGCRAGMFLGMATGALFATAKGSYLTAGIIIAITTVLWFILAKNKPVGALEREAVPLIKNLRVAARVKNVWIAGLGCLFFWGGFMAFTTNVANGLHVVHGIDPVKAGFLTSMLFLGNTFGNLLAPMFAEKVGRMKPFMYSCILGAIGLYFGWNAPTSLLLVIFLAVGFLLGLAIPFFMVYPVLLPEVPKQSQGVAGGIIDFCMLLGAFCIPSFIIAPFAGTNFNMIFGFGIICTILVGVCTALLPELGKVAKKEKSADISKAA